MPRKANRVAISRSFSTISLSFDASHALKRDVCGGIRPGGRRGRGERDDDKLRRSAAAIDYFDVFDNDDTMESSLCFRLSAARGPGFERRVVPGASQGTTMVCERGRRASERARARERRKRESICLFFCPPLPARREASPSSLLSPTLPSFPSPLPPPRAARRRTQTKQVQGSPPESKREFLRGKGLTEPEIDEAFRRAPPDPTSVAAAAPSAATPPPPPQPTPATNPPLRWTQIALRLGAAAAASAGMAHVAAPRLKAWSDSRAAEAARAAEAEGAERRKEVEAGAAAARAEASATAALAGALAEQTAALGAAVEELRALARKLDEKVKPSAVVSHALPPSPASASAAAAAAAAAAENAKADLSELLRAELRAFGATLPLAVQGGGGTRNEEEEEKAGGGGAEAAATTTETGTDSPPLHAASASTSQKVSDLREKLAEMQAKEAKEAAERARKGKAPLAVTTAVPPAAAPTPTKAAAVNSSNGDDDTAAANASSSSLPLPKQGPAHPASYMDVLAMLERGETPPGIRDDIEDTPPAEGAAKLPTPALENGSDLRPPLLARRPKPWENALLDAARAAAAPLLEPQKKSANEGEAPPPPLASHPLRASAVASALSSPPPTSSSEPSSSSAAAEPADASASYASALSSGFPYGDSSAASKYLSGAGSGFGAFGGGGGGGDGEGSDGDDGDGAPPSGVNAGWKPPGPPPRTLPVNGGGAAGGSQ